jgi:hypothetical protein
MDKMNRDGWVLRVDTIDQRLRLGEATTNKDESIRLG